MLDLGFQELIVIFIVALLVFGPKKLPELARALGRGIGELKSAIQGVKDSIENTEVEVERIEKDIKDVSEGLLEPAPVVEEKKDGKADGE